LISSPSQNRNRSMCRENQLTQIDFFCTAIFRMMHERDSTMKRTFSVNIACIVIITLFSVSTAGCCDKRTKSADFLTNSSHVYINTECSSAVSFHLALFSKQKIHEIKFAGLEGNDIYNESLDVDIYQNDSDIINSYKYQGYHLKYIMIEIKPNSDEVIDCNFERIALNVDGVIRKISFTKPVEHKFSGGNIFTEPLQISVVPNDMPSAYINDTSQYVIYEFLATEDIMLQEIRFSDFIYPANVTYTIDGSESMEAVFPISVSKGQRLKISFSFMSETADKFSYVTNNIYFDYLTESGMSFYNSAVIVFDPIFPILDNNLSPIRTLYDHIAE